MPYVLKPNKIYAKDPNSSGFLPQNVVADATTQEQVAVLQAEGDTQKAAIEVKGLQTRATIPDDYTALSDSVNNLKSTIGDFHYLSGSSRTRNVYLDYPTPLSGGEEIKVKVLSWNQPVSNRTSIIVYALGEPTNVNLGTIDIDTVPTAETTFTVPVPDNTTYTGIRVYCRNEAAIAEGEPDATATARLEFVGDSYLSEKLDELDGKITVVDEAVEGVGFAFNVSGASTATSRNIYCDKSYTFSGGGKIAVRILKWSSLLRQTIRVYVFDGDTSINLGTVPIPYSQDAYYTFDVPSGEYDKVRVAFQNTVADGVTECQALIVCATDGAITNGFVDNAVGKLNGIKINCLGDSLTYGYIPKLDDDHPATQMSPTWCEQLAADLQCTVRNYGITNNVLSNNPGGSGTPMCLRYTAMDDDADVVIVMGGTNDFLRVSFDDLTGAPLGTIDSAADTTFYGAYNVLVQGLIAKYFTRKTRIILMVPPMRNRSNQTNGRGFTLMQYQQAVRDIANKYALPYVDWAYDAGISAYLISTDTNHIYTYDGIHIQQEIILGWILPMIEKKVAEVLKQ